MGVTAFLTALFFFFIGYLVKRFPNTISGYNTMSKERKAFVDIEGLSSFMKLGFITMGLVILIGCTLFHWMGLEKLAVGMYTATIIFGTIYILLRAQQFNHFS